MRCKVGLLGNAALASPATLHSGTLYHAPVSWIELVQQSRHRRNKIVDQDSAIRQEQQFCMVLSHSGLANRSASGTGPARSAGPARIPRHTASDITPDAAGSARPAKIRSAGSP